MLNYSINIQEIASAIKDNFPEIPFAHIFGSSALLAHEALAGKILYVREEQKSRYASFYSRIAAEYEDKIYWIRKQLEYRGYEVQWDN
jgi:hypothetical protein